MREADPALKPAVLPTPSQSPEPRAAPHQPDGHDYPGLVVLPGPRPGMPRGSMPAFTVYWMPS